MSRMRDSAGRMVAVPVEERFWPKVDRRGPDECWPWLAVSEPLGYGRFSMRNSAPKQAHRVAYELLVGPIPAGLELDHLCRNPNCVNPAHLEPVTHAENLFRARRTQCKHGHPMDPTSPRRGCRTCDYERQRARRRSVRTAHPTHCPQGHDYAETAVRHGLRQTLGCRVCMNARNRAYQAGLRAARRAQKAAALAALR